MPRLNFYAAGRDVAKAMTELQAHVSNGGLDRVLTDLIYLLVSEINGCAYCIDMHKKDLRALGESEIRLDLIRVWREAPGFYSSREQAAFAWAESVTLVSKTHVPDEVFDRARKQFSDEELAKLTLAVVAINAWNRFAIAFRSEPGQYKSNLKAEKSGSAV